MELGSLVLGVIGPIVTEMERAIEPCYIRVLEPICVSENGREDGVRPSLKHEGRWRYRSAYTTRMFEERDNGR